MEPQAKRRSRTALKVDPAPSAPAHPAWEVQLDPKTLSWLQELRKLRIALVHDWLANLGGGERVLAVLHQMFPKAPVYTTVLDRGRLPPELKDADIRTAFTNRLPMARSNSRALLPLYAWAARQFDLRGYDLQLWNVRKREVSGAGPRALTYEWDQYGRWLGSY